MTNVTDLLLAQMLMARPQMSLADSSMDGDSVQGLNRSMQHYRDRRRPNAQLANINIQQIPFESVPQDLFSYHLLRQLMFNTSPVERQKIYESQNRETETDPAPTPQLFDPTPISPSSDHFGNGSSFPRPDTFDRTFRRPNR